MQKSKKKEHTFLAAQKVDGQVSKCVMWRSGAASGIPKGNKFSSPPTLPPSKKFSQL
jgi:hypothetical protein